MQRLVDVCIRRPVFASMLIATLVVIGIAGFLRLGQDRVPAVDLPTVNVRTSLPGASTEEVETLVSQRIEEAVNTIEGIDQLRSISTTGASNVTITFRLDREIEAAAQDVRDRVASVLRDLPPEADPPIVSKFDNDSSPVLTLALSADRPVRELTEIADKLVKPQLERSSGVGEVRIQGGAERAVSVWVDADRLRAYGIPITAVRDAIQRENSEVPGGAVTGPVRESVLRTMGRLTDPRGFEELVVATRNGSPIRIRDVARVEDGTKEVRSIARLDGEPCVTLEIRRQSGANTMLAIEGVKARVEALRAELPPDLRLQVLRDQSRYIEAALSEIELHLVLGSLLATAVVLVFMRSWRSTLIAAIAIPCSVVSTFGIMDAFGFTLNGVTMLALVLMVGIVIDDAIVVLENVFRFIEEKGLKPFDAAREGTAEISLAVLATTLSLVVIFVPVSFMSSVSGRFLYEFGITAAAAVLVSLLVSFTLTPMMSARLLRPTSGSHGVAKSRSGPYAVLERAYMTVLGFAMRRRWLVALLAAATIASAVPLYGRVKQEYAPTNIDEAEFEVTVAAPEGASLEAMDAAMRQVEGVLRATPGIRTVLATTGGGFISQVGRGEAFVRIAPHEERVLSVSRFLRELLHGTPSKAFEGNYSQGDVMRDVRKRLAVFPELRCAVRNLQAFNLGTGPFEIDFAILGPDIEALARYGEELRARARELGGIQDPDTTLRLDRPELRARIERERAADLGVSVADIATALRLSVGGEDRVSRFRDLGIGEDYDVQVRLEPADRSDPSRIAALWVPASGGRQVPLASVARLEPATSASRIDRMDRQRQVSLRASVGQGYALADRIEALRGAAASMNMPTTYTTRVSGRGRELERTIREFLWAFLLSIVLMYAILASQFESLVHPLTILLSLPLSVPFALWSLDASGSTLNLYSALGILVLFGVVKKNAILQIDHTNQLRAQGLERLPAILQANRDRLRPILMTTFALVAGMLPLWAGSGPGAEERRTIAVVVIGGQSLSLLLTLVVTPVAYSLFDDLGALFRRKRTPGEDGSPAASGPVKAA
ncbi:MAG: efflux RND transporter permease subunit [Planctomycetota bacterium]|nr:efflux RND transporter permease subunit [Planctomycetota bacterium]